MTSLTRDSPFDAMAKELLQEIERALPRLQAISDAVAREPRAPGKWSAKQVIGHLIDSAANNHHRFVRAQESPELTMPGYAQDHWVDCQRYNDRSWPDLLALWEVYNRHLAHVIGVIPDDRRGVTCRIGSNAPATLGFIAADYVWHLRHHLAQVLADT